MKSDNKLPECFIRIYNYILDIVYPKNCVVCNRMMGMGVDVCICRKCRPLLKYQFKSVRDNKYFEEAVCALEYSGHTRDAMQDFKFHGKRYLGRTFGTVLYNKIKDRDFLNDVSLICPVPIHPLRDREYNQSELIARYVCKFCRIPLCGDLLIKIKNLTPLSTMNFASRRSLIKSVFDFNVKYNIKDKTICLVDDIYTTGSTVNECSRILKMYGAKKVYVISACYADTTKEGEKENADTDITGK